MKGDSFEKPSSKTSPKSKQSFSKLKKAVANIPEWKKNIEFIDGIKRQNTPSPLDYKFFEYEDYEWDNMP